MMNDYPDYSMEDIEMMTPEEYSNYLAWGAPTDEELEENGYTR